MKIRDFLVKAFIGVEFVVRNFPVVAELAFVTVQTKVFSLIGAIQEAFQAGMPGIGKFLGEVFSRVFNALADSAKETFRNVIANVGRLGKSMPKIMAKLTTFDEVWEDANQGLQINMDNLPALTEEGFAAMGEKARARQKELLGQLAPAWDEFFQKRWAEIFAPAKGAGGAAGVGFFGGIAEAGRRQGPGLFGDLFDAARQAGPGFFGELFAGAEPGFFGGLFDAAAAAKAPLLAASEVLPEAFLQGSKEATSAIHRFMTQGAGRVDPQREMVDEQKKGNEHLVAVEKAIDAMRDVLERNVPVIAGF